jgi:hypothetical protein
MKKNEDLSTEALASVESAWDTASAWIKEHKVVSALAAAAVLYFVGGRRIRHLAALAVKSGITAGVGKAAIDTFLPESSNKPASQAQNDLYH